MYVYITIHTDTVYMYISMKRVMLHIPMIITCTWLVSHMAEIMAEIRSSRVIE